MVTPRPKQENAAPATETRNIAQVANAGWLGDVRQFIREVVLEMKKVSWPTRAEVINTTMIVVVAVFFFAFFLVGTDIVLAYLIARLEDAAKWIFS